MTRHLTGYYAFGGGSLDGRAIKNALKRDDLQVSSVGYAASGAGVALTRPGALGLDAEVQTIVDQDAGPGYETALGLGYGLVNTSYSFQFGRVRIAPLVGLGGGGIGLDMTPVASGGAPELTNLRLNRTNFLVHLGLHVEFRLGGRFGMTVGGRTGYVFAPFSNREGIRGPYFRLFFGGSARV
jgi:hypothetical protein